MAGNNKGPLECVLCGERFAERDVTELRYFPSTQVCFACYKKGQNAPYATWCFGKQNVEGPGGKILEYGFDEDARACGQYCPDRKICKMFIDRAWEEGAEVKKKSKELVCPFRQTKSQIARVWMACATKGMLIPEIVTMVKREGGNSHRVLRVLRSGELLGVRWRVDEANGFLKLTYISGGVRKGE
jgi:hypothetical protein